jgi:hypothetical protein
VEERSNSLTRRYAQGLKNVWSGSGKLRIRRGIEVAVWC